MKKKLYSLSAELIELRNLVEAEDEFIDETEGNLSETNEKFLENRLEIKKEEMGVKLDGYVYIMRQFEAQAEMGEKELKRITAFVESKKKAIKRFEYALLQATLLFGDDDGGIRRLEFGTNKLSTRRNPFIKINDHDRVPKDCLRFDVQFKNLTFDIKNFLARRIQELPDSIGKSALVTAFEPGAPKYVKKLIKEKLENQAAPDEQVLTETEEEPWAEKAINYSLTIK